MKIMFICTGNICRSAMAHKLLEKKLKDNKINNVEVYSCGIYAYDGDIPTEEASEVMEEYGVDMSTHKATNIAHSKIKEMDLILCATMQHKNTIIRMYPELKDKLYTMKEYINDNNQPKDLDIKDPWGYGIETYRFCASEIEQCIDKLIQKIK